jgi:hypothetical protein
MKEARENKSMMKKSCYGLNLKCPPKLYVLKA